MRCSARKSTYVFGWLTYYCRFGRQVRLNHQFGSHALIQGQHTVAADDDPLRNDDALSKLETLLADAADALKALTNV